eukprot:NODE_66_length_25735_cov_0.318497.p19 type:complete len:157 gc:universal NODE_66_length_25735_cov_0.318497:8745-9215(+)
MDGFNDNDAEESIEVAILVQSPPSLPSWVSISTFDELCDEISCEFVNCGVVGIRPGRFTTGCTGCGFKITESLKVDNAGEIAEVNGTGFPKESTDSSDLLPLSGSDVVTIGLLAVTRFDEGLVESSLFVEIGSIFVLSIDLTGFSKNGSERFKSMG